MNCVATGREISSRVSDVELYKHLPIQDDDWGFLGWLQADIDDTGKWHWRGVWSR